MEKYNLDKEKNVCISAGTNCFQPRHEETGFSHVRKQRRRSAVQKALVRGDILEKVIEQR